MPDWEVRVRERIVRVEADNWIVAVGVALPQLGVEPDALIGMICEPRTGGALRLRVPRSGLILNLRPAASPGARQEPPRQELSADSVGRQQVEELIFDFGSLAEAEPDADAVSTLRTSSVRPARFAMADADLEEAETTASMTAAEEEFPIAPGAPPPLAMPTPSFNDAPAPAPSEPAPEAESADRRIPPNLAQFLLERGIEIATARRREEAAALALTVLRQAIPAESGAVLYVDTPGGDLRFLAAQGPRADEVLALTVPAGEGIAGFCVTHGKAIIVADAAADLRHHRDVDQRTGYRTQAVLAVPLRDGRDHIHGCIELLNPPGRFLSWHLEAARSVAVALAESLRSHG